LQLWSKGLLAIAGVAGLSALCVSSASAAPITGTVNISGSVAVGGTFIDFQPPVGPPSGSFVVSNTGNTGSFAGLNNTSGTVLDLNEMVQTPGVAFPPLNGFLTFASAPTIRLDLTSIDVGSFTSTDCFAAPAAGQTCTPPLGFGGAVGTNPFNLNNTTPGTSTASITFHGNAVNTSTGEVSSFIGVFSSQFTVPYQTLLQDIAAGQTISTSYSASITTTSAVPEPATMILLGSGLIGIFVIGRKRTR
jgi:hypothetical protein